ncbi:MAG: hypothetical protein LBL33_09145 [Tannerella sp.]|jgi:hypothetical protein|nr:hypothetical protein [Tannerella sp.]
MKTFFLHYLRSLFFITAALFASITAYAQDYAGYDYVERFNTIPIPTLSGTLVNNTGSCASAEWLDAPANTDGILRFNASNQGGGRNSTFTLTSPPAAFTSKLIAEFDWYPASYTGGGGDEGQISFRNGANVIFTVYNLRGSNDPGIAAGPLNGGKAATVDARYRTSLTDTPLSQWYHIKAEIYAGQRISFTITQLGGGGGGTSESKCCLARPALVKIGKPLFI